MEEGDTYLHPRGNGFPSSASARATASEHRRRCGGADPNFRDSDGRTAMHNCTSPPARGMPQPQPPPPLDG
uniref:Uncharacterized protein n=1 Tax=Oryza sativa subsp. japonica TaxID=39947 RepID=Q6Z3I2_ORYSJ|nr:hypothetical protein [Oryza sativa Japonica Group]BAD10195.1 hypothetical protein [Oryza sativa Japonica Group]